MTILLQLLKLPETHPANQTLDSAFQHAAWTAVWQQSFFVAREEGRERGGAKSGLHLCFLWLEELLASESAFFLSSLLLLC